jgi:hypothetical protein
MLPGQSFAKSGIAEISAAAELKFGAIKQTFAHLGFTISITLTRRARGAAAW